MATTNSFEPMPPYPRFYLLLLGFALLSVVMPSCGLREPDHEAYFKKIINQAYHLPADRVNKQAIPYVDSVYRNFKGKLSTADVAQLYDFKTNFYLYYPQDYDSAMLYADSMLQVLASKHNKPGYNLKYATACLNKGNILYRQKYYSSAYQWYYWGKSSLNQSDSCSYNKYMSRFSACLANVCYEQGKYRQAIRFWHEAINKMTCENGYDAFYKKQGLYDDIGLCYRNLKRPDEAIAYFDKAIALIQVNEKVYPARKTFVRLALGLVYGNQGDVYLQKGLYQQAEKRYRQSISINSQKNHLAGDARLSRLKLAAMYIKQLRFSDARLQLDTLKPQLDTHYRPEMLRWLQTNAQYYKSAPNGNADTAYNYLSRYVSLKDTAQAEQRILAGANFKGDFDILQQRNTLKEETQKNRLNNILMYATILMVALITALMGAVIMRKGGLAQGVPAKKLPEHRAEEVYLNWYDEL